MNIIARDIARLVYQEWLPQGGSWKEAVTALKDQHEENIQILLDHPEINPREFHALVRSKRELAGFSFGYGGPPAKRSPSMCPWNELDQEISHYFHIAHKITRALQKALS
ncbi:hypothetical protein UFOVP75_218 [uncultured Caudovirales phage]|uniref:Uncharacterized protein n=1 Tax=uncultured Caudovirales phage TaxID=2100421 RepID=A0A6J5KZI5_9CAUD|nr:hypothetical protein UFOVP75_218 [uncultured Caudovirales phage]